jgi:acetyltransferase-like isoleucine patch superfamily enzyme
VTPTYTPEELAGLGLKAFGRDVSISRLASVHGWDRISMGDQVRIDDFAVLTGGAGIEIGSHVHISAHCALYGGSGITLEDYSGLSPRSLVFSESDDFSGRSLVHPFFPKTPQWKPGYVTGRVTLRRFAQTGAGTTILPGVTFGEGAVTGAHTLVTDDLEPWWIYVGTPARKLRERERDVLRLAEEFQRINP